MTENLLQFIWQHRLYAPNKLLKTMDGETLTVVHPGRFNLHAGPDFLEAKIKINDTLWVGNVEVHIHSSDWNKHKHQLDQNYDKLILHVVYKNDEPIKTMHNTQFPTLELQNYLSEKLWHNYERLMESKSFVPCENSLTQVKSITIQMQLERMLAERLEEKIGHIYEILGKQKNNWQEVFFIQLARGFGLHINQDQFEQLALNTPLALFAKHKNSILQIEALLFGQAGFLSDYFDEQYPSILQKEYLYLKKIHHLEPMPKHLWKFLRLRPANFPTLRIAQFAQLIFQSTQLFSKIANATTLKDVEKLFEIHVSDYWHSHYTFGEVSKETNKSLGKSFIHTLIINVVVPTLFIYGKLQAKPICCDRAIQFLELLKPEKNNIIQQWESLHVMAKNAADTQSLLQLHKKYCLPRNCLSCGIGYEILKG